MSSTEVPQVSRDEVSQLIDSLYARVDAVLADAGPANIPDADIQRLMTLAVKLYAARRQQGHEFPPHVGVDTLDATEVSIATMGLLESAGLDLFELSLWRHWGTA